MRRLKWQANLRSAQFLVRAIILGLVLIVTPGCTDNATKLSSVIKSATSALEGSAPSETARVQYTPKTQPDLPYFIVFFPDDTTDQDEVEQAGLPKHLADRVFEEMSYLSVGEGPFLVVVQPGAKLAFTTHWNRFASVSEVLVVEGRGPVELLIARGLDGGAVVDSL